MLTIEFTLKEEFIELFKLLKAEGIASTGGEAKLMIADGSVMVNGIIELRKRNKLRKGDVVSVTSSTDSIKIC